ncbi:MAG: ammonium transporter, partial [Gammaproteobacteria bacterium]|nr:ammonium transporter [Gammaproteobacteria bacterium]
GTGGVSFLSQLTGTLFGVSFAFISGLVVYGLLKQVVGIRLTQEEEYEGADLSIHKIASTAET